MYLKNKQLLKTKDLIDNKLELYPLVFKPILKEKVWGGSRIAELLNSEELKKQLIGEAYTISGLDNDCSVVEKGPLKGNSLLQLIECYKGGLLGEKVYKKYKNNFPILVKIIDAKDDLSIQVHPNNEIAKKYHNSLEKNELWCFLETEDSSKIISGFKQNETKKNICEAIENGKLCEYVNSIETNAGDSHYIPAGRLHSIGGGNLLVEIQNSVDITYRVFDFDRRDKFNQKRELHVKHALEALNYNDIESSVISLSENSIFNNNEFIVNHTFADNNSKLDLVLHDSFSLLFNIGSDFELLFEEKKYFIKQYQTVLLPANIKQVSLVSENSINFLESYIA